MTKTQTKPLSESQCFIRLDIDTKATLGFPLMNVAKKRNNKLGLLEGK